MKFSESIGGDVFDFLTKLFIFKINIYFIIGYAISPASPYQPV